MYKENRVSWAEGAQSLSIATRGISQLFRLVNSCVFARNELKDDMMNIKDRKETLS